MSLFGMLPTAADGIALGRHASRAAALLGLLILLDGCRPAPPSPGSAAKPPTATTAAPSIPWFAEVAAASGVNFRHSSGHQQRFWFPEIETGGVGLIDYDGDGLLDIFCVDGGSVDPAAPRAPRHRLYHNRGNWRFEDVTEAAGIHVADGYGMGCAVGDYDGDGWPDLYLTQLGSNHLFHNNGNGTFTDVTAKSGTAGGMWSTSAAFLDYDGDGRLDLVVVNYVRWNPSLESDCSSRGGQADYCSPKNYQAPTPVLLFHNRGDGTFEDVSHASGVDKIFGNGFGVATGDFNHDGRIDFYIANDAMPNQLWLNQGNGRFIDDAQLRGCALNALGIPRAGMGVVAVDLTQRGWLDLYVTHLAGEGNGLFANQAGNFLDALSPDGPMAGSIPRTGFGVGFADFNNDANLDLFVANGRVRLGPVDLDPRDPYAEPNTLMQGMGGGHFRELQPQGGTSPVLLATSRGAAFGDLDNDGAVDVVVINKDGPLHLLKNVAPARGHWILLNLRDANGREVRNAVVRIDAGGKNQWRQNQPNEGYCSSNDPRLHFGLGNATGVDHLWVRWPNGVAEDFGPRAADAIYEIRATRGKPAPGSFDW